MLLMYACSGPDTNYRVQFPNEDPDVVGQNGNGNTNGELVINQQFQPYYDSFINEMLARNVDLRDIPISIEFINPDFEGANASICGLGYFDYDGNGNARVEIVNSGSCWSNLSHIEKENLIFHEFGHALLARFHLSDQSFFPNGSSKSIMCSGNGCSNFSVYRNYQIDQRDFYLYELIDENIDMPSWANSKIYNATLVEDNIIENTNGWLSQTVNMNSTNNPYSYFIDDNEFFTPSYSLGITSVTNTDSNTYGNWYKDFEISGFEDCANLIATVNFKLTAGLTNGYLNLHIDLFDDVNSESEFSRYYAETEVMDVGNGFYRMRSTAVCIPEETVKFRIGLVMKSESNATVYFDDLKVDLYE